MLYMHPKITPCTLYWVRKRHWTSVLPASEVRPGCGWWSYGPRGPWRLLRGNEPLWSIQLARWTSSASCQSHWMDSVRDSQTLFSKSKKCWWKDFKLETLLLVTCIKIYWKWLLLASQCRHRKLWRICRCWSAETSCRWLRCRNSRRSQLRHWASHQRCSVERKYTINIYIYIYL